MTAPVDIANLALDAVASRARVSSINPSDGSQAGDICSRQYQVRLDSLSRSAHWQCLRRQKTLTLLKSAAGTPTNADGSGPTPPEPWLYEYALPNDYLKARFIPALISQNNAQTPVMANLTLTPPPFIERVAIPFAIAIDTDVNDIEIKVLLTNWSNAQLVYTAQIANPDLWDSQFTTAFVAVLASFMQTPLNANTALLGQNISIAKAVIDAARISDGNEGPSTVDHLPDWIAARGWRGIQDTFASGWMPWDAMVFPEGLPY